MKNNMENLTITKEKVLEAASKCDTAKATLKVLFPEVFEKEDKNAFVKEFDADAIRTISTTFFGSHGILRILATTTGNNRNDLLGRAFWVDGNHEVLTGKAGMGTYIEIRKK